MKLIARVAVLFLAFHPGTVPAGQGVVPPEKWFGFRPGDRPATVEQILGYLEHLAENSLRARLEQYARSYEGRPLVSLIVSSPANIERMESIRRDLARLADPRSTTPAEAAELAARTPAVAWLAFSVHGDELSGSDAAVALAWRLCSARDEKTSRILENIVVIIDPMENPDGRARTLAQISMFSGTVPSTDRRSIQHAGMWPWGRWNHYWFDPNRDYLTLFHPETRGRVAAWLRWTPQLVLDAHEMWGDSTFLLSPPRHPFNPHLPAHVGRWLKTFAQRAASAFAAEGRSAYTRSWNEEFFMGYGSGWPKFFGAIGILHEQAGTEGQPLRQRTGRTVDYGSTVEQQLDAAWSQLESLAENRRQILEDFSDGRRDQVERGKLDRARCFFILPGRQERSRLLAATLLAHGIELQVANKSFRVDGLREPWTAKAQSLTLPAGTILARSDQPLRPLLHNLLDFHQPMSREFLREERLWLERKGRSRLYETTAWSLSLMFGAPVFWSAKVPAAEFVGLEKVPPVGRRPLPKATYGWLVDGTRDDSIALAARLAARGHTVRVATEPFVFGGRKFGRGTLLLRIEENEGLAAELEDSLRGLDVEPVAANGVLAQSGPDLGGEEFQPLRQPRTAMLAGHPFSPVEFGEIWYLFDRKLGVPFSGIEIARFKEIDLDTYNVLVIPPCFGGAGECSAAMPEPVRKRIESWVRRGGTLVAIGSAAQAVASAEWKLVKTRPRAQVLNSFPPVVLGLSPAQAVQAGRFRAAGLVLPHRAGKDNKGSKEDRYAGYGSYDSPYDVEPVVGDGASLFCGPDSPRYRLPDKPVDLVEWAKALSPGPDTKPEILKPYLEVADGRLRRFHPRGAILRVDVDGELWLGFGLPEKIAVHFRAGDVLVADWPVEVPARFASPEKLHLSGLLWPEAAGRIARTAYVAREQIGRGQVILFADDPAFRAASLDSARLVLNAVVLGPGLGTHWSAPWR